MFVILGGILSISAITELNKEENRKTLIFRFLFLAMTLMLCLRYGQGTDYYPYQLQYEYINISTSMFVNSLYHGEIGWYILMMIIKRLGCSFYLFIGIISMIMMLGMYKAITKYSPLKNMSLLLMYPTYYMTYMYSAIRQGIVVSFFLSFGLDLLNKKRYLPYFGLVIVLTLFHRSAIILALLPFIMKMSGKKPGFWVVLAFGLMIVFGYTGILNWIGIRFGAANYFRVSVSLPAIAVRLLLGFCVIRMQQVIDQYERDDHEVLLYYIYMAGLVIYVMLSFTSTLSQRATMPMKAVELLLIPKQISLLTKISKSGESVPLIRIRFPRSVQFVIPLLIIAIMNYELIKNINSYIVQGNYYDWVNVFTYPYISIFNKSDIFEYISHFD